MKIRNGFVSNSSSCSFVVDKKFINMDQMQKINNHIAYAKMRIKTKKKWKEEFGDYYLDENDSWSINEEENRIVFSTDMDNFPLWKFLKLIGIHEKHIEWEYRN